MTHRQAQASPIALETLLADAVSVHDDCLRRQGCVPFKHPVPKRLVVSPHLEGGPCLGFVFGAISVWDSHAVGYKGQESGSKSLRPHEANTPSPHTNFNSPRHIST